MVPNLSTHSPQSTFFFTSSTFNCDFWCKSLSATLQVLLQIFRITSLSDTSHHHNEGLFFPTPLCQLEAFDWTHQHISCTHFTSRSGEKTLHIKYIIPNPSWCLYLKPLELALPCVCIQFPIRDFIYSPLPPHIRKQHVSQSYAKKQSHVVHLHLHICHLLSSSWRQLCASVSR